MKTNYVLRELMELHIAFCNKIMQTIDKNKRFVHDRENQIVITEKCKYFGLMWRETRRQTYAEVFAEDFDVAL